MFVVFIGIVVKYDCGIQPMVQIVYNLKDFSHYLTSKLWPDTASARTHCSESCTVKRRALRSL